MKITIERAKKSDAPAILDYLKQIGGETENLTFGAEGLPFSVEAEMEYLEKTENSQDNIILLAKENGKIIGDASLSRLPRRMRHRGELGISVLKEHWSKGVGSKLLEHILDFASKNSFDVIDLEVRSDNVHAIHLYKKFGFEKIGSHPAFFKIDDEYISFDYMCLKI